MMTKFEPRLMIGGLLLLTGLVSCRSESGDGADDHSQAEAEIGKIEREWAQVPVTGDPGIIKRILVDDLLGVSWTTATGPPRRPLEVCVDHLSCDPA